MKGARNGGSPLKTGKGDKAETDAPSHRERLQRHAGRVRAAADKAGDAATATAKPAAAAAAPATDTVGKVFGMLSLAGLAGLAVINPTAVTGLLQNGVKIVRTIISGR